MPSTARRARRGRRPGRPLSTLLVGLVLLALPAAAARPVPGYPIDPVPLRELVQESGLIVVLPGGEGSVTRRPGGAERDKLLAVQEVLFGEDPGGSVAVTVGPWICPAPAHYDEHTRLAFLVRGDQGGWWTQGLSYGARDLSDADLEIWVARIRELVSLEWIEDDDQRARALGDWQLRCLAQTATRDEAVLDLNAQLAQARRGRRGDDAEGPWLAARLPTPFNALQLRRLASLALVEARRGRPEPPFLRLVDELTGDDPRLPAAWVDLGGTLLEEAGSAWALRVEPELRRLLVEHLDDEQLTTLDRALVPMRREQPWGAEHLAALERFLERARELVGDDAR